MTRLLSSSSQHIISAHHLYVLAEHKVFYLNLSPLFHLTAGHYDSPMRRLRATARRLDATGALSIDIYPTLILLSMILSKTFTASGVITGLSPLR